ncbi:hypothetical protein HanXRQr2_Chr08g0337831 [Helianthus annuus]|uniref:Uncharacterized protein n=1 Tax=Helianthus annuus TaxID=4232 RepID=A0A9K3IEK0_HELAN|nr:hypothetical protein HanXRQr2_Chr08g0337831 [Helianthus annuus]KAJ0901519.1 hypothetical protein HanPSC8_Chr08g0326251 [Helianthus annuus]
MPSDARFSLLDFDKFVMNAPWKTQKMAWLTLIIAGIVTAPVLWMVCDMIPCRSFCIHIIIFCIPISSATFEPVSSFFP